MSFLSTEQTLPELSGLGVNIASGVFLASGNPPGVAVWSGSIGVYSGVYLASGLSLISGQNVAVASGLFTASGLVDLIVPQSGGNTFTTTSPYAWSGGNTLIVTPSYKQRMVFGISGLYNTAASSVPNLSGGVALSSGIVNTVTIRNFSGQAPVYVGFSGTPGLPASGGGAGFILYGGDGLTVDVGPNMNLVYVVANTSGSLISHFGTVF